MRVDRRAIARLGNRLAGLPRSISAAGFSTEHDHAHWKSVPPIVASLIIGRAVKGQPDN
jgi:hypothetical protein